LFAEQITKSHDCWAQRGIAPTIWHDRLARYGKDAPRVTVPHNLSGRGNDGPIDNGSWWVGQTTSDGELEFRGTNVQFPTKPELEEVPVRFDRTPAILDDHWLALSWVHSCGTDSPCSCTLR